MSKWVLGLGQQDGFQVPRAKESFECPLNGVTLGSRPGWHQLCALMGSRCINQEQRRVRAPRCSLLCCKGSPSFLRLSRPARPQVRTAAFLRVVTASVMRTWQGCGHGEQGGERG